jgi:thermitase
MPVSTLLNRPLAIVSRGDIAMQSKTEVFNPAKAGLCLFLLLIFTLCADRVAASELVNVDARVAVEFSPYQVDAYPQGFSTVATITNTSVTNILSPLRIIISSIDPHKVMVANGNGATIDGDAFIEIEIADGALEPNEAIAVDIGFEKSKKSAKSKKSKKSKKSHKSKKSKKSKKSLKKQKKFLSRFSFDHTVLGGSLVAPQPPTSIPFALASADGVVFVDFSVGVLTDLGGVGDVFLRNLTEPDPDIAMNDLGQSGDQIAGDHIFGVRLPVDGGALAPGECFSFAGVTSLGGDEIVSAPYELCVTSFPTRVAESNQDENNIITLDNGNIVLADEVLIIFNDNADEDDIANLVDSIGGEVVGSILPLREYQVKLDQGLTEGQMEQLVDQLNGNNLVAIAAPNGLVEASASANDTQFGNQRGLKAIHVDDAWDTGATGAGITVIVLDEGVDAAQLDFVPGTVLAGGANTDGTGHGTQMAGIIAAQADNMLDVAGIAYNARIRSVFVDITTDAGLIQGYLDAAAVAGSIVNVSLNKISPAGGVPGLCASINSVIVSGTGKVVVNSAGNNSSDGSWWPGNCNSESADAIRIDILGFPASDKVVDKSRFIVVSATDCNADDCAVDTLRGTSNFGAWVDVAAPGNSVPTLQAGGSTVNISGTSPAAAMVSAAAANLAGCGVGLSSIEAALSSDTLSSSLVQIPYSGATSGNTPRIDMVTALETVNSSPTGINLSANSIDELTITTPGGVAIGTLSTVDANTCDTHSYRIAGGADAGDFSISGNELKLTDGILDFETKSSYAVTVTSTDYFGQTTNQAFVVNVNDLIEGSAFAIDFDTRQDGTPYTGLGDLLTANEYDGVSIQGNDPLPGFTSVDQVDSVANPSTDISGYHVRVGAFSSTPATQLDLNFTTAVTSLSFDFGSPSGGISVEAFDASSISLGVFHFSRTGTFINQAGFPIGTGSAVLSGIGNIAGVEIRPALANEGLLFDNLNFVTP